MKRKTLRRARSASGAHHHHSVYVVLLDPAAKTLPSVRAQNPAPDPAKDCLYVGMTGLSPEQRFLKHKEGIKAAYVVKRFGIRLLPDVYAHLNPMPYEAALQMEKELAEELRREGFFVMGGH